MGDSVPSFFLGQSPEQRRRDHFSAAQTARRTPLRSHGRTGESRHTPNTNSKSQSECISREASCPQRSGGAREEASSPTPAARQESAGSRGSSCERPVTFGTPLHTAGGSSSSTARASGASEVAAQDWARLGSATPRTPSPRGSSQNPLYRQGSCRSTSADLSLSNSSSCGPHQAGASGSSLPSVPALPPLHGDEVRGAGINTLNDPLAESVACASTCRPMSDVLHESLEADSAFLTSLSLGGGAFGASAAFSGHLTARSTGLDPPRGEDPAPADTQECMGRVGADAPGVAPPAHGSTGEPDRWQSMLEDVALLSAQVDELLQRQQTLLAEPSNGGQCKPSPRREAWVPGPGSPVSTGPTVGAPRRYDPCRYLAPDSPRSAAAERSVERGEVQGHGDLAQPLVDSLEERSLTVQARLREQAQQVFARRCNLERWRSSPQESGLRGAGGVAVQKGGSAGCGLGSSSYSG